jgi:glucose-1-phosphate thymidylyltransferase
MMLSVLEPRSDGDVDAASELLGPVVIGAGAKVVRSRVVGPAIVGAGTLVEDSTVGPNVAVSPACVVVSSAVEDSIVMEGSRIEGVRTVSGSILGRNVEVRHSGQGGINRLVVGDQSRVEVD